jgi:tetratricopeptide (TPR) repeat protein
MMPGTPLQRWKLASLALGAAALLACGGASGNIVGSWKGTGAMGYNQDVADFFADGSCKALQGGERRFCSWTERSSGGFEVRYGADDPDGDRRAEVEGDQMLLKQGDQVTSSWVRAGSPLDKDVEAYTRGQSLIQAGDWEHGMAALKEAADRGFAGGQNSLAWNFATAKDPRFQDGKQAVSYAEKAVAQSRHHVYLDTLAAALARDGQFRKAAETETEALALLEKDGVLSDEEREAASQRYHARAELYQGGQPYTQP